MKWAIILILFLIPMADAVEITEVMANPLGNDSGREWVEVYSDEYVNIESLKLVESGVAHSMKIFSGNGSGYMVISDHPEKFLIDYPNFSGMLIDSSFSLSNKGEEIQLMENGTILSVMEYEETEEGMSWCGEECVPTPGYHMEFEESVECEVKEVEVPVIKEVVIEKEVIVEVEKKDILFYVDSPNEVNSGDNITTNILVVNQLNRTKAIQLQSYAHNGSKLVSESYMNGWKGGWSGNKQVHMIDPESMEIIQLVNRADSTGTHNLRIKVKGEDLSRTFDQKITILPKPIEIRPVMEDDSFIDKLRKIFNK